jgi:hypothetical protein
MQMLADTEQHPGRWVLVPSKSERFLGPRARAYVRARDRRRAVFTVMIEAFGIVTLIGLVPPLRMFWIGSAVIGAALAGYVGMLLHLKAQYEAEVERGPKRAVPLYAEPEILENELRILQRRREAAAARRAIAEPVFEMPSNVRVYAAR